VLIDGTDIYDGVDVVELRRRVGMVSEVQPVPEVDLPKTSPAYASTR
jgi:ABC-type phosphate transport system ATPase subunit